MLTRFLKILNDLHTAQSTNVPRAQIAALLNAQSVTTLCCCLVRTQKLNTLPRLSTLSARLSDSKNSVQLKILNCWIDTRLIHVFGFVQCTFQTCVRRFHSHHCNLLGSHVSSSLVVNSCCLMSNRWEAFSVHQLSPNVNSLDTARLQIPTVSVLSPSATAFESFIECFLAALSASSVLVRSIELFCNV